VRRVVATALGLAGLLGCAAGPAPPDHFYRIAAPRPAAAADPPLLAGTLSVQRPRADALTDERAVLYRREGSQELLQASYDLWVDPPTSMLQSEMVRWLREAAAAERVVTPDLRVRADHRLASRLLRLEHVTGGEGGRVVLEIELALSGRDERKLLLLETYREEWPVDGGSVAAAADAFGRALGAVLERFVADVAGALESG
jgi:cholesterol transport system auxiliary component